MSGYIKSLVRIEDNIRNERMICSNVYCSNCFAKFTICIARKKCTINGSHMNDSIPKWDEFCKNCDKKSCKGKRNLVRYFNKLLKRYATEIFEYKVRNK